MIRILNMNIEGNIAIVCITENGKKLALNIQSLIANSHVYVVSNKQNELQVECETKNIFLWVYKENSKAINLYKKLGFTIKQETRSRYYMQKIL